MLVKVAVIKYLGENFFGQDVLDQHLTHIGIAQRGVDGLLRMRQKPNFSGPKFRVFVVLQLNHLAQGQQHGGKVCFELLHSSPKTSNLGPLKAKEQFQQLGQRLRVSHVAAQDLRAVLPEHGHGVVTENDVVLRVAFFEFLADLGVQVVVSVFGFPVAQRHAQFMQERAVHIDVGLGGGLERVLGQKDQVLLLAPVFEQVFERLTDDGFTLAAAHTPDDVELLEVVVDEELTHGFPDCCDAILGVSQ